MGCRRTSIVRDFALGLKGWAQGYRFEEMSTVMGGKTGYADVFKRGVFAWEDKAPGKNLDTALKQLLTYNSLARPQPADSGPRPSASNRRKPTATSPKSSPKVMPRCPAMSWFLPTFTYKVGL